MPHFTSRTAIKMGRICERKRYNAFHALGTGLVAGNRVPIDLMIGQAMHSAAQMLFEGQRSCGRRIGN
jgi:hypothetical protein